MTSELISQAQEAIQRGDKATARILLRRVILKSPQNAQAWFMLAQVVENREQVIECLQRGLRFDPENVAAHKALAALTQVSHHHPPQPPPSPEPPVQPAPLPEGPSTQLGEFPVPLAVPLKRRARINWSLWIGALIVLLISLSAVLGPRMAARDPLEENVIVKINDVWETPPLAPLQYKEYPLGTDQFGRDLLSRVLWAMRPTLVMVVTVSLVRLWLGTLIGLSAGWASGTTFGHWLDVAITAALAVPVFIVTLGVIAMLGAEMGLMAFVIGFSINGWGETARIVREQTQAIKEHLYIEAAQALGAPRRSIIFGHVLRQIMPMIWMLLAFEISNTLMVTAGLGFLGYYIGGDVWIEVGDFVSRRVSGMPELGQMLATSWAYLTKPWPMVITGTVIFLMILGFNLLGEGLRASLNPEIVRVKNPFREKIQRFSWWWDEQLALPARHWVRGHVLPLILAGAFVIVAGGGFYWWRTQIYPQTVVLEKTLPVPGDHLWASDRGDPYGTYWSDSRGPDQPQILWLFQREAGFAGGPAISADQTLYIGVRDGRLLALQTDRQILWEANLPEIPVGPPALSAEGVIYIGDQKGGLAAVSPQGELLWHFQQAEVGEPIHGPIVDGDGNIYYLLDDPREDHLISLDPAGQLRWSIRTGTKAANVGPRLDPDGGVVYLKNLIVNTADGNLIEVATPADQDPVLSGREQYLIGADGLRYLNIGHNLIQWEPGKTGFEIVQSADWNYVSAGFNQYSAFPQDAGVTRSQVAWLFYSWEYGGTKVVWVDISGKLLGISWTDFRQRSKLVVLDDTNTAFVCGVKQPADGDLSWITKCLALAADKEEPLWELILDDQVGYEVIGTAMSSGNLYVVTDGGYLYAIHQSGGEEANQ